MIKICNNNNCLKSYISKDKRSKYCSRSCAAIINNSLFPKRGGLKKIKAVCLNKSCKNVIVNKASSQIFCSTECSFAYRVSEKINKWLNGEWDGSKKNGTLSPCIRKYLLNKADYECKKCKFNIVHPVDGNPILEIHHKDGNPHNHNINNLEVLCPNCHALTSTFKSRNKGSGQKNRYKVI